MPGCGTPAKDALRRAMQGAGMESVMDRKDSGPLQAAILRERIARIKAVNPRLFELLADGTRTKDAAEMMGVSPGRVSQLRREMMEG